LKSDSLEKWSTEEKVVQAAAARGSWQKECCSQRWRIDFLQRAAKAVRNGR